MKFTYFNDTNRPVKIHPATFAHGASSENKPIQPLEERTFSLPKGSSPWVKMWGNGEAGLTILVSPTFEDTEEINSEIDHNWVKILDAISNKVSSGSYKAWFLTTKATISENTLTVYCSNLFQKDWIEFTYIDLIAKTAFEVLGRELDIILKMQE
ncbi:DnaA N-terminal domain-containing protein [Oceanobacillus kapialis]|uniref:DnaA N-terminal domain-containing protein n=1 Tax=Oceanobacillus kapialis TaxID=481353 RepID=A0ABW5Q1X7_9BACI